ncbi:hypothetical protein OAB60_00845 [Flavobacteriaceae bacterium]|nr:hypothetical protein [Flavobacteriaceae bacterium]
MKKILLNIILIVSLVSCSNPTDISIMEKISNEDVNKILDIDEYTYSGIMEWVAELNQYATQLDSVTFSEITYKMLFDFEKEKNNKERWDKIEPQYAKEWDDKYGIYYEKADSIVSYWKLKYENEKVDRFIKVEPISISRNYDMYGGETPTIKFKLTNLSGKTISGASFRYKIVAKVNDDGDEGEYKLRNVYDVTKAKYEWNRCGLTEVFNKSTTGYWKVPRGYRNNYFRVLEDLILPGFDVAIDDLKTTHNIYVIPYKVTVNNKNYENFEYIDIPKEIRYYIDLKEDDSKKTYLSSELVRKRLKDKILYENLNLGFEIPGKYEKFLEYYDEKMSEEFPLVSKYILKLSKNDFITNLTGDRLHLHQMKDWGFDWDYF